MQHPPSKTPPTSRLHFLTQTTPPPEENNNSTMDVEALVEETSAPAASYYGVRFQPGTRFHEQTRPRPPLTPGRPRTRISEPSLLDRPRKLDLTRLLHEVRYDGETDAQSWSGTMLDRSESETKYTKPKNGQHSDDSLYVVGSPHPQSSDSGEGRRMDLDTKSSWLRGDTKKSAPGISPGFQNKRLFSPRHEKIHPLTKAPEDTGSRHSDLSASGADEEDSRTDEDEFWDPRVDKISQGATQQYQKQWSPRLAEITKSVHAPSRLQHLMKTTLGESGRMISTPGESSSSEKERRGYDIMSAPPFSPTSVAHWHGDQPSEASTLPFLSPRGYMGSCFAPRVRGSPYPSPRNWSRHARTKAREAVKESRSPDVMPIQVLSSSRLLSSLKSSPLLCVKTVTSGSPGYEIVSSQTPHCSTPRHYAVEDEDKIDQDWPSSPLANHFFKPVRTEDEIEDKLYTASPHAQASHIPFSASHHPYRSSLSPVDGEEDPKENDHFSQEYYSDNTGNANLGSLRGYMTPKRSSSTLTPPGPPVRNRNVRTRIASLQDTPTRIQFRCSPSDYEQSPRSHKLSEQSVNLPMFYRDMLPRRKEPLNYELDDGKNTIPDLDSGTFAAFLPSSATAGIAAHPSETTDTTTSFGATAEQEHKDMSTTDTMNAKKALDDI